MGKEGPPEMGSIATMSMIIITVMYMLRPFMFNAVVSLNEDRTIFTCQW